MREPGVFDRFRFAPADDRSRELKGGDGARGDCGLGTAATKAASFDGDFLAWDRGDSAGDVGFGTFAMNAARGDCCFRGDRAGDSRLFREEKAPSASSGDADAAGSGDLLEAQASRAPSAPAVSAGGVLGSDGAADAQAESESGWDDGSVFVGDGSSSVDAGDGSAAGSISSVRAGDMTGDGSSAFPPNCSASSLSLSMCRLIRLMAELCLIMTV